MSLEFTIKGPAPGILCDYEDGKTVTAKEQMEERFRFKLKCGAEPIRISLRLHMKFCELIESWRRPDGNFWYHNTGWLLGKNEDEVLVDAQEIKTEGKGCASFIDFKTPEMQPTYIALVRKGLTPCGLARVSSGSVNSFKSHPNSKERFYWEKSGFKADPKSYFVNYQPVGAEFLRSDCNLYPYQIINLSKKRVSVAKKEAECVNTSTKGESNGS